MLGETMFDFDESKVPEVVFKNKWDLEEGSTYELYECDGWTFEYFEDERVDEIEHAKRAIYSWIAWLNWLESKDEK
jgi:hypothetical protein